MKKVKTKKLKPGDLIIAKHGSEKCVAMVKDIWPNGLIDCLRAIADRHVWEPLFESLYYEFYLHSSSKKVWVLEPADCIVVRAGVEKMKAKEEDK